MQLFDRVLDELGDFLFQCHIFGVGEPLLDWPRTREIIDRAHRRRIFTLVSTNSTLITEAMAEEIVTSGLDHIVCAIDGVSQEGYGAYRVGGKAEDAIDGMRRLCDARRDRKSGINIEWQFLVNRFNHHEVEAAREKAEELGVYLRLAPLGGMEHEPQLQDEWLPPGEGWQDARVTGTNSRFGWPCYWLWRAVVLNSNGHVARCPGFQTVTDLGSVESSRVGDIYNGASSQRAPRVSLFSA